MYRPTSGVELTSLCILSKRWNLKGQHFRRILLVSSTSFRCLSVHRLPERMQTTRLLGSALSSRHVPRMVKGGGETTPRPLILLPFPNRLELMDAPWRLFLNMNWLQDGAFRPYLTHSRNPAWRSENRKYFEISANTRFLCIYYNYK